MAEPVLLSALQTNLDWARSSAKSAPIGCAVASAQRSGSTTPYCCTVTTVANRDYIVLPHSTGLAALQVASPLTVTPLPLVQFPPDGQIISVDVIQVPLTAGSAPSPVLAVAFLTQGTSSAAQSASPSSAAEKESAPRCWLHFYGYRTHAETLTALTGDCQALSLDWIPAQITHLNSSVGFLIAGSDLRCHLFLYNYSSRTFTDTPLVSFLPELLDPRFAAPALCIAAAETATQRLIAVGFQNGRVLLSVAPLPTATISVTKLFRTDLDGPITALCLAGKPLRKRAALSLSPALEAILSPPNDELDHEVSLLVGGGIGFGVQYSDAAQCGFDRPILLPDSHVCDAVLAAHTSPLSREGMRENVLLGTYGHELFMYAPAPTLLAPAVALSGRIAFEAPIYALLSVKLSTGLPAVAVITGAAVHLLAPSRTALSCVLKDAAAALRTPPVSPATAAPPKTEETAT